MVTTLDLPLNGPDQAVVNFLIGIALRRIKRNSPESLTHDVHGASELITWIVQNGLLKNRSLRIGSTLVLGNTLVLNVKANRLVEDAKEALEKIKRSNFLAIEEEKNEEDKEEEERRKRAQEQMDIDLEDDDEAPKKKKKKKRNNGVPPFIARIQDITLPAETVPWRYEPLIGDDLEMANEDDYKELMEMTNPDNTTFVDGMAAAAPENIRQMTPENEPEIRPWRNNYPVAQDDYFFEPRHDEQRASISMEREMDDARDRGLQGLHDVDIVIRPPEPEPEPQRIEPEPPRIEPEPPRIEPEPLRIDPEPPRIEPEPQRIAPEPQRIEPKPPRIEPEPPSAPRAPRALRAPRAQIAPDDIADEDNRFQITPAQMRKQRKNYSKLHYKKSDCRIPKMIQKPDKEGNKEPMTVKELISAAPKKIPKMTLEELLKAAPYSMRKPAHKELAAQFPPEPEYVREEEEEPRQIRYRDLPPIDLGDPEPESPMYPPPQSPEHDEEEEEEEEEPRQIRYRDLPPIDLDDPEPVVVASPMYAPPQSPEHDEEKEEEEEEPRQIFNGDLAPIDLEDLEPVPVASSMNPPPQNPENEGEEEEEEEEEPRQILDGDLAPIDLEDLEPVARPPIDLEELDLQPVAVASPMYPAPQNPQHDEEEEEEPHQILAPTDLEDREPMAGASPMYSPPQSPRYVDLEDVAMEHEYGDDPFEDRLHSKDQIRKDLLVECKNVYPSSYQLDRKIKVGRTTCREAAGTFYAALVLLKNQAIEAKQESPFGPIDLTFTGKDSDDLGKMANDVEAMEVDDGNTSLNNL